MEVLKGIEVARAINEEIAEQMKSWEGALPHLAIIRVGENPDDMAYEREKRKRHIIQFIDNTKKFIQENEEICRKALQTE